MNTSKSKVFKVEKEEKQSSEVLNICVNGEFERINFEKDEITPYERKYYALLQRCEIVKQSNERLVNRIYHVKKLLRRRKKERKFLMDRLDGYGDDYKAIALSLFAEVIGDASPTRSSQGCSKAELPTSSHLHMDLDL